MQKKSKWLTVVIIIIAVLVAICFLGYVCSRNGLLDSGDSFYPSDIAAKHFEDGTLPEKPSSEEAGGDEGKEARSFEDLNLSAEDFKALQDEVSLQDKMAVMKLLSKGLSASDYAKLAGMLGGGIDKNEVKEAYQIISRGLSSEDKDVLWGYYDKYKHLIQ